MISSVITSVRSLKTGEREKKNNEKGLRRGREGRSFYNV